MSRKRMRGANNRVRLSALVLSLMIFASGFLPSSAEPVYNAHFSAARKDHFYEFGRSFYACLALIAMLHGSCGDDECSASEPVSLAERNRLRKSKTHSVYAEKNADELLFDDPGLFNELQSVYIESAAHNETYLKALALYYPDILSLYVLQEKPLSDDALKCLKSFKNLMYLELNCPVESPELLRTCLPRKIMELRIHDTSYPLPDLPNLRELTIDHCRLDPGFFDRLDASHLERVTMHSVNVPPGACKNIAKFKHLRELASYNSSIDSVDVECFRQLPYLETNIRTVKSQYFALLASAEKNYSSGKFVEAIARYDEVALGQPAVHTYVQIAKCYLQLGNLKKALENCAYAADLDPNSEELASLIAEIKSFEAESSTEK